MPSIALVKWSRHVSPTKRSTSLSHDTSVFTLRLTSVFCAFAVSPRLPKFPSTLPSAWTWNCCPLLGLLGSAHTSLHLPLAPHHTLSLLRNCSTIPSPSPCTLSMPLRLIPPCPWRPSPSPAHSTSPACMHAGTGSGKGARRRGRTGRQVGMARQYCHVPLVLQVLVQPAMYRMPVHVHGRPMACKAQALHQRSVRSWGTLTTPPTHGSNGGSGGGARVLVWGMHA